MSDTVISYQLREYYEPGKFHTRKTGTTESELRVMAESLASDEDREFKIVAVITTESVLDIFTIPAIVYTLEELAEKLSDVYASSVDWDDEQYLRLSAEDKEIVKNLVDVDSCDNCGWEFNTHYLNETEHGTICDRCETDLEAEEDGEEDDE